MFIIFVIKFNYFLLLLKIINSNNKFDLNLKNSFFLIFFLNHDFFPALSLCVYG